MKSQFIALFGPLVFAPVVALLLPVAGFGAETVTQEASPPPAVTGKAVGRWSFAMLPRALQQHPRVGFNVISELTEAGRQVTLPTPEAPAYYQLTFNKTPELGSAPSGGGKGPNPEFVEESLRKGLAQQNLLSAQTAGQPATLLLFCHWGEYGIDDSAEGIISEYFQRKQILDRARLIGGDRFAKEFAEVLDAEDHFGRANPRGAPDSPLAVPPPVMGDLVMPSAWSPMECFRARSPMNRHLVEELTRGCYFVVVSAYDMKAALEKKRVLLWRTRMTVNSDAVSMQETMVPLITNGSVFLGRDMTEPVLVASKIDREGRVDFGPPEFLYWVDPADRSEGKPAPAAPAPAKAGEPKPAP